MISINFVNTTYSLDWWNPPSHDHAYADAGVTLAEENGLLSAQ